MEHCLHFHTDTLSALVSTCETWPFFIYFFLRLYLEAICGCSWTRVPRNTTLRRQLSKQEKNRGRGREMIISHSSACLPSSSALLSRSSSTRSNYAFVQALALRSRLWPCVSCQMQPLWQKSDGGTSERLAGRHRYRPLQSIHLWALGVGVQTR